MCGIRPRRRLMSAQNQISSDRRTAGVRPQRHIMITAEIRPLVDFNGAFRYLSASLEHPRRSRRNKAIFEKSIWMGRTSKGSIALRSRASVSELHLKGELCLMPVAQSRAILMKLPWVKYLINWDLLKIDLNLLKRDLNRLNND